MDIRFHTNIDFSTGSYSFNNILTGHGSIWKPHKFWEFQLAKIPSSFLFGFQASFNTKQDHAGFRIELTLFGLFIEFQIYDHRHWDYEANDWEVYAT